MKLNRIARAMALVLSLLVMVFLFSGCVAADGTGGDAAAAAGGGYSMIIMIVIMVIIFYFFLIRPENKKKKQAEEMRSSLSVGDQITTIGGIIGRIVAVKSESIVFETSEDRVRMEVTKWAISSTGKQTEEQK